MPSSGPATGRPPAALGTSLGVTSEFLYPIVVCVSSITTFLTPYLIRWSDPLAGTIHRIAPKGLIAALEVYVSHVRRLGETDGKPAGARLLRRLLLRLLVGVAFITAVFVSVRIVRPNVAGSLALLPDWLGGSGRSSGARRWS